MGFTLTQNFTVLSNIEQRAAKRSVVAVIWVKPELICPGPEAQKIHWAFTERFISSEQYMT
ncbi:rCG59051 [Rattus norvegicus]|uniref:RCG59051 n=1 Tax=Rattus norvegicus TaxID=10116 RepID=A6JPH5_RAT|nr:rCG59051 [Rattus norvegicus]